MENSGKYCETPLNVDISFHFAANKTFNVTLFNVLFEH